MKGIGVPDFEAAAAESLLKELNQLLIQLEGQHTAEAIQEGPCECPASGTDLEHPWRLVLELGHDPLGDRAVDEEVLAEATALGTTHRSLPKC
jgi:hypothetical protein